VFLAFKIAIRAILEYFKMKGIQMLKNKIIPLMLLVTFTACSQINRESREYYKSKKASNISHGISVESRELVTQEKAPIDLKAIKRGEKLFKKNCVSCHGLNGEGTGPLAKEFKGKSLNLVKVVETTPHFKLFINLSKAKKSMPGWDQKDFSKKDLNDLTQYLRTLGTL
jgi:cytochrome c2